MSSGLVTTVALLRRDALWHWLAIGLGAALAAMVLLPTGFERLFVFGSPWTLDQLYPVLLGPALLVGALRGLRDDLARTRELVEHRSVSRARLAWTDALSGAALVGAWVPFAGGLVWLQELVIGLGGDAARLALWGPLVALSLALVAHYALALLLVRLPVGWPWRLALGLVLALGLESIHSLLAGLRVSWPVFALAQLLACAFLLAAFGAAEGARRDLDRPVPGRALSRLGIALLLPTIATGGVCASAVEAFGLGWIRLARPVVALTAPGELTWLDVGKGERFGETRRYPILDDEERPTGRVFESIGFPPWAFAPKAPSPDFRFSETRFLCPDEPQSFAHGGERRRIQPDPGARAVRVIDRGAEERREWLLERPDGRPVAGQSEILLLSEGRAPEEPFVLDAEDFTLWRIVGTPPSLVAAPLPDGDRARRSTSVGNDEVLVGERGAWAWHEERWEARPQPWSLDTRRDPLTCTTLDPAPFRTRIEVTTPDGLRLEHRFGLRSSGQRIGAGIAVLGLLVRPLPLACLGALTDYAAVAEARPDEVLWLLDPLLGLGHRRLLWAHLACTLVLASLVIRSLSRRGLPRRRTLGWALALVLTGFVGLVPLLAFETRRAWRRPARTLPPSARIHAA